MTAHEWVGAVSSHSLLLPISPFSPISPSFATYSPFPLSLPPFLLLLSCCPGYEPVIVVTCLDLIYQDALSHGHNFEVEVQHKKDQVLQAFEDLNLPRQSIYFVTNFHEGRRGVRVWAEGDRGFEKVTKKMVDLARDLLTVADRFIERKYTSNSRCCLL